MASVDLSTIKIEKRELHVPTLEEVKNGDYSMSLSQCYFLSCYLISIYFVRIIFILYCHSFVTRKEIYPSLCVYFGVAEKISTCLHF